MSRNAHDAPKNGRRPGSTPARDLLSRRHACTTWVQCDLPATSPSSQPCGELCRWAFPCSAWGSSVAQYRRYV